MKLSTRLAQLKRERQAQQSAAAPAPPLPRKVLVRRWALAVVALLLAGGGAWAALEAFVWNKIPRALVGTWAVQGGPLAGGTFTFARDGTLAIYAEEKGKDYIVTGRVIVDGQTMLTTTQEPRTRREQTRTSTIRELTPDSLVLELENGQVLRMVRRE